MDLTLPRRRDGQTPLTITLNPDSSLVIIGANGSGKTRFTDAVVRSLGDKAYRMSALDALYTTHSEITELPDRKSTRLNSSHQD